MLSGFDLDGDEYDLVPYLPLHPLHPPYLADPGNYAATPRLLLDRDSTVEDVADFVVNLINNDTYVLIWIILDNVHHFVI